MTTVSPLRSATRAHALSVLLIAPAVGVAAALVALEAWRTARPGAALFSPPPAYVIADAIERHDVRQAHRLLRQGLDPNTLVVVRDPELTSNRERLASPLWWAVAQRDQRMALMLIDNGARIERTDSRDAACLAVRLGDTAMSELLQRYAAPPPGTCEAGTTPP